MRRTHKIYIAGNFEHDREMVATIAKVFELHGYTITFKWWDSQDFSKRDKAVADLEGVMTADDLVVLMDRPRNSQGTWVEVGAALAIGIPVSFIGDTNEALVFRQHPGVFHFHHVFPTALINDVYKELDNAN